MWRENGRTAERGGKVLKTLRKDAMERAMSGDEIGLAIPRVLRFRAPGQGAARALLALSKDRSHHGGGRATFARGTPGWGARDG